MPDPGFELILPGDTDATFIEFNIAGTTTAKGMKIIDRCTQLPLDEFEDAFGDARQRGRGPMMLAMLGLSILNAKPSWSAERVMDVIDNVDMAHIAMIGAPEEDAHETPLSETASVENEKRHSPSRSVELSPQSTPKEKQETTAPSSFSSKEIQV